jgi:glycosyltransferase involved in cell wall biosynthesis
MGATTHDSKPLHVVHVAATANGAHWMYQMLRELRARGYRSTAVIARRGGTLDAQLTRDGIPFHAIELDVLTHRNMAKTARSLFQLVRLLRRIKPDVVQYHLYPSVILGRLAAWLADVPARFSMIAGPYYLEAPVLKELDIETARVDSRVIASCEYTRTLYVNGGVPRDHVDLIYYGQDAAWYDPARADPARVRRELGIAPDRPVVGDVAYFYPPLPRGPFTPPHLVHRGVKGHDVLLRAVPKVLARVPDALFVLVGEGWGAAGVAYEAQLKALARELGVADAVLFAGARTDIPDTLAAFDVSVQCSLNENLGGSIESLMMERPLVVSAVGGLVDAVKQEQTGLLVPPDDSEALADAVTRLLLDRPLAKRLAVAGRQFALEQFTLARTVDALDVLYRSELDRVGRASAGARRGYRVTRTLVRAARLTVWGSALAMPALRARRRERFRSPRIVQMAGGTENGQWLVHICRSLRAEGRNVSAVIGWPEGSLARQLRAADVPYDMRELSFAPGRGRTRLLVYMARLPLTVLRLAWQFRRQRVTIVHTHIFNSIFIGRLAAWLARVPCRVSMVPGPLHLEAAFTRWADRMTWWMDHRVVAGSEATRDIYRSLGMSSHRLRCISYGADATQFDPARVDGSHVRKEFGMAPDVPVIGLIAYFYPPRTDWQTPPAMRGRGLKGHEDFIAAAHLVRRQYPTARFLLVGAGWRQAGEQYRQRLMARCCDEGLGDAVVFTGHRDDVPDVLAAMDVAVQCSLSENYGGTIEALLLERPTVATRVGGMPETVRDGETGLLVPPADPAALADAICRLLADPERAHRMAAAGRVLMLDRYTIDRTAALIAALYDDLLAAHLAAPPQATADDFDAR